MQAFNNDFIRHSQAVLQRRQITALWKFNLNIKEENPCIISCMKHAATNSAAHLQHQPEGS